MESRQVSRSRVAYFDIDVSTCSYRDELDRSLVWPFNENENYESSWRNGTPAAKTQRFSALVKQIWFAKNGELADATAAAFFDAADGERMNIFEARRHMARSYSSTAIEQFLRET